MHHGNLNSEIVGLRIALALPFTPAEDARQAARDAESPRDIPTAQAPASPQIKEALTVGNPATSA